VSRYAVATSVLGVSVLGTIQRRFPFPNGADMLDVATAYLDTAGASFPVHVGAWTLTVGNYSVRPGDRVALAFWHP
jgi:hypothetical protein